MGTKKRKNESGAAVAFMSRGKALKKLQLSLLDFRRLCILKGVYPHEPRHPKKAGKGSTLPVTYYFKKDIQFLLHEPIIQKMREYKIFVKKLKKAADKKDPTKEKMLRKKKPEVTLDHVVKERYPTMVDALRDLDDALSICFLYAKMPKNKKVHSEQTRLCRRLTVEFLNYVVAARCLRKVFISIKGYYFQLSIQGETVTWLMPHNVAYDHPSQVDYRIMSTFVEFSTVLLGFVNFALYKSIEVQYPPQINSDDADDNASYDMVTDILSSLSRDLTHHAVQDPENMDDEALAVENQKVLFKGLKFFLNREVDREIFTLIIRSFGGEVSWCKSVQPIGAKYDVDDESITHHIIDRPIKDLKLGRTYVQPQWVADCVNARKLLSTRHYEPGATLPPHLSPFVQEEEGAYVPPENDFFQDITSEVNAETDERPSKKQKLSEEAEKPETVLEGQVMKKYPHIEKERENEERKLRELTVHKKNKRLYEKLKFMNKKKKQEFQNLTEKRKVYEKNQKNSKK